MPLADEPQPSEHQRQAQARWLTDELARIDRVTPRDPGRITARRLNRAEYNNTVRDLLGVDLRPGDDFPQDDSGYGFDNIADVLSLSPALMEQLPDGAERVSARGRVRSAARGADADPAALRGTPRRRRADVPLHLRRDGASLPNAFYAASHPGRGGTCSASGWRTPPGGSAPITIALWIDQREAASMVFDAERPRASTSTARTSADRQQMRLRLPAGDHAIAVAIPRIFEGLPASRGGPNPRRGPNRRDASSSPPPTATPERIAQLRKHDETQATLKNIPLNGVRIASRRRRRPTSRPRRAGRKRGEDLSVRSCRGRARARMHASASSPRWRRAHSGVRSRRARWPLKYVELARKAEADEKSFEEGLAVGIQALLVSPDFLFRIERPLTTRQAVIGQPVTQHQLASRLSHFLWASMPDEALRRAADAGTLRDPRARGAGQGMLRDPRSQALAEQFGGQWLQFRALESTTRNRERFPTSRTICACRCAARPSCSSPTSSARIGASWISSTRNTPS